MLVVFLTAVANAWPKQLRRMGGRNGLLRHRVLEEVCHGGPGMAAGAGVFWSCYVCNEAERGLETADD